MPINEFRCICGEEREELVAIGTNSIKCQKCGKDMKKIISLSSFHLKGGGWASSGYTKVKSKHKR